MKEGGENRKLQTNQRLINALIGLVLSIQSLVPAWTMEYVAIPQVRASEESSLKQPLEAPRTAYTESLEQKIVRIASFHKIASTTLYNLAESESQLGEKRIGDNGKSCGIIHFHKDYYPEENSRCEDDEYILNRAAEMISKGEEWKFTPCSCVSFAKAMGVKLTKGDADDLFPNTDIPVVGGVIIMKYKNGRHHLIPIMKDTLRSDGIHAVSANKKPCKITREIIPYDSKEIMGFYRWNNLNE